jgi:hypothetical protein
MTDGTRLTREGGHGVPQGRHKMAREVIDMTTSKNAAEVDALVSTYMTDEGFRRTAYGQEEACKKGHGFSMPQFLTARVADGNVHIEACLKYPILPGVYVGGELGMTGKMGCAMKAPWRKPLAVHDPGICQGE